MLAAELCSRALLHAAPSAVPVRRRASARKALGSCTSGLLLMLLLLLVDSSSMPVAARGDSRLGGRVGLLALSASRARFSGSQRRVSSALRVSGATCTLPPSSTGGGVHAGAIPPPGAASHQRSPTLAARLRPLSKSSAASLRSNPAKAFSSRRGKPSNMERREAACPAAPLAPPPDCAPKGLKSPPALAPPSNCSGVFCLRSLRSFSTGALELP